MLSKPFARMVDHELSSARSLHPIPHRSFHESYAIILEELEEFWEEVKKKPDDRDRRLLLDELVQIAAMCQRAAEDSMLVSIPPKD